MHRQTKIRVTELNPHILCVLCGGYMIDATTIAECLHSFCRSCITRYLETSKVCPICDTLVHKTRPHASLRSDKTLQNLVYKLVPGLFKEEMKRRREFYGKNPASDPIASTAPGEADEKGSSCTERVNDAKKEQISLCLQHSNRLPTGPVTGSECREEGGEEKGGDKRYLLCPAAFQVGHLKKFIRTKYDLPSSYQIEIFYSDECLRDNYTLMDIAHVYTWTRLEPLKLYYAVYESSPCASSPVPQGEHIDTTMTSSSLPAVALQEPKVEAQSTETADVPKHTTPEKGSSPANSETPDKGELMQNETTPQREAARDRLAEALSVYAFNESDDCSMDSLPGDCGKLKGSKPSSFLKDKRPFSGQFKIPSKQKEVTKYNGEKVATDSSEDNVASPSDLGLGSLVIDEGKLTETETESECTDCELEPRSTSGASKSSPTNEDIEPKWIQNKEKDSFGSETNLLSSAIECMDREKISECINNVIKSISDDTEENEEKIECAECQMESEKGKAAADASQHSTDNSADQHQPNDEATQAPKLMPSSIAQTPDVSCNVLNDGKSEIPGSCDNGPTQLENQVKAPDPKGLEAAGLNATLEAAKSVVPCSDANKMHILPQNQTAGVITVPSTCDVKGSQENKPDGSPITQGPSAADPIVMATEVAGPQKTTVTCQRGLLPRTCAPAVVLPNTLHRNVQPALPSCFPPRPRDNKLLCNLQTGSLNEHQRAQLHVGHTQGRDIKAEEKKRGRKRKIDTVANKDGTLIREPVRGFNKTESPLAMANKLNAASINIQLKSRSVGINVNKGVVNMPGKGRVRKRNIQSVLEKIHREKSLAGPRTMGPNTHSIPNIPNVPNVPQMLNGPRPTLPYVPQSPTKPDIQNLGDPRKGFFQNFGQPRPDLFMQQAVSTPTAASYILCPNGAILYAGHAANTAVANQQSGNGYLVNGYSQTVYVQVPMPTGNSVVLPMTASAQDGVIPCSPLQPNSNLLVQPPVAQPQVSTSISNQGLCNIMVGNPNGLLMNMHNGANNNNNNSNNNNNNKIACPYKGLPTSTAPIATTGNGYDAPLELTTKRSPTSLILEPQHTKEKTVLTIPTITKM